MSTPHLEANLGDYADTVLLPGDPLRAQWVAETYLRDVKCVNKIRNMLGFTGTFNGKRISVQGSGMGQASLGIYVNELYEHYNVKNIIRIGSCGAIDQTLTVGSIVAAMTACTDSGMPTRIAPGWHYSPSASYHLLENYVSEHRKRGLPVTVGCIASSDNFYQPDPLWWRPLANHGVVAVEMETYMLYTLAHRHKKHALSVNTVSDNIVTEQWMTPEQRQTGLDNMVTFVLDSLIL